MAQCRCVRVDMFAYICSRTYLPLATDELQRYGAVSGGGGSGAVWAAGWAPSPLTAGHSPWEILSYTSRGQGTPHDLSSYTTIVRGRLSSVATRPLVVCGHEEDEKSAPAGHHSMMSSSPSSSPPLPPAAASAPSRRRDCHSAAPHPHPPLPAVGVSIAMER